MKYPHRTVAFVSGIAMIIAIPIVAWHLVPDQVWRSYDDGFSKLDALHQFWAHAMTNVVDNVLPIFLVTLTWSWITLRWLARPPRVAVWWCLGGLIVGLICQYLYSGIENYWGETLGQLDCLGRERAAILFQLQRFGPITHLSSESICQYWIPAWYHADQPWRSTIGYLSAESGHLITSAEPALLATLSGLATAAALALRTRTNRTSGGAHLGESYSAPKGRAGDVVDDPRIQTHLRATPAY
jgi:hypothetical protein